MKTPPQLYKITKTQYEREYDIRTGAYGDYRETSRRVDYRTNKGAVTLSFKNAEQCNAHADRMQKANRDCNPRRYKVEVEVCDLPEFQPACICEKHGVQPMFNVPGLTGGEYVCLECI